MAETILVADPTAPDRAETLVRPQGLSGLYGRSVGFVDNRKPNFARLVDELAELLLRAHGVREVVKRQKAGTSIPVPQDIVDELAARCDLVILGSAD